MTLCGEKVTGVCVLGKCPHFKRCHPVVWDKYGKIKPLTNEEWFCGLSTEEKAKFLFEHGVIGCQFCKGDCVEIDYKTKECKYNVSPSYSYTGIVMWLKEKHNESV